MNLIERALVDDLAREAHAHCARDGDYPTHDVAVCFVGKVRELEASGAPWVDAYLDSLMVAGAKQELTRWRRRTRTLARTRRGAKVYLPEFAGTRRRRGTTVVSVQKRLVEFDVAELRAHRRRLETTRDTYSKVIRILPDLIDAMEEDPSLTTAGHALEALGLAA